LKKDEHPLIPKPEYDDVPDEGELRAGFVRSKTISIKKPTNDSEEEDQPKKDAEIDKKITYPNMNKFHDYYASSFVNK
jgi:hypothetical protein